MKTALLLIDIQKDYFKGGRNPLEGSLEASLQAGRILAHFRSHNLPLVHIFHISIEPDAPFFLPETEGIEIHPNVAPAAGETIIKKHFPNSFMETPLLENLRSSDVGRIVVAGMMTHMCVDSTVRAAVDLGFEVWLAHDACATMDLEYAGQQVPARSVQLAFLAALQDGFASVLPSSLVIEQLK